MSTAFRLSSRLRHIDIFSQEQMKKFRYKTNRPRVKFPAVQCVTRLSYLCEHVTCNLSLKWQNFK